MINFLQFCYQLQCTELQLAPMHSTSSNSYHSTLISFSDPTSINFSQLGWFNFIVFWSSRPLQRASGILSCVVVRNTCTHDTPLKATYTWLLSMQQQSITPHFKGLHNKSPHMESQNNLIIFEKFCPL